MSRSGYSDDFGDPLELGRWRAQVMSAIRGKRGQAFLMELAEEMDLMPEKRLIDGNLIDEDGECCAIGVVCKSRGIDVEGIDPYDAEFVGGTVGVARQLAAEIVYMNDECGPYNGETPEQRWLRMRVWVQRNLK